MAKTKTQFRDKFERKQRLAQRPPREEEEFDETRPWLYETNEEETDVDLIPA